ASPSFRHYLSPEQFTERFGPTAADYQAVIDFANSNGLKITHQNANRLVLDVEGTVTNIEKAVRINLRTYRHPTEARNFFAPDPAPSLTTGTRIVHIGGLNNYIRPHPKHVRGAKAVTSKIGSAPGGGLMGNDFRQAYVPGTTLTGAGQCVGLVE